MWRFFISLAYYTDLIFIKYIVYIKNIRIKINVMKIIFYKSSVNCQLICVYATFFFIIC